MNGKVVEDTPGAAVDLTKLLNIRVPAKGEPMTNYNFTIQGAGGTTTQVVPADLLGLLQEVADMHGHPGLGLVMSFLNCLRQVQHLAPGQTLEIDTQVRVSCVCFTALFESS